MYSLNQLNSEYLFPCLPLANAGQSPQWAPMISLLVCLFLIKEITKFRELRWWTGYVISLRRASEHMGTGWPLHYLHRAIQFCPLKRGRLSSVPGRYNCCATLMVMLPGSQSFPHVNFSMGKDSFNSLMIRLSPGKTLGKHFLPRVCRDTQLCAHSSNTSTKSRRERSMSHRKP